MGLSCRDYNFLLKTIGVVYDSPYYPEIILDLIKCLEERIALKSAAFIPQHKQNGKLIPEGTIGYNFFAIGSVLFCSNKIALHPFCEKGLHINTLNKPIRITDIREYAQTDNNSYFNLFQKPNFIFHELCMTLSHKGDFLGTILIYRGNDKNNFTASEIAILGFLLPHLARALHRIFSRYVRYFYTENNRQKIETDKQLNLKRILDISEHKTITTDLWDKKLDHILLKKLLKFNLTARQIEIAIFVIKGLTNKEIAKNLFITEQTVKDHLNEIFKKMDVRHRNGLISQVLYKIFSDFILNNDERSCAKFVDLQESGL